MLRIILTLCFVFGTEKDDKIRLSENMLYIFTDIEKENLTISILDLEEKSKENLILKDQENLLNLSTESKSRFYALDLPNKDRGTICFECKMEKSEGHLKSYLYFKTEKINFKTVYILERPMNVLKGNTRPNSRVKKNDFDVASFTYIRNVSGNNYVLTISKSFEDKCNLDMEIEMRQMKFFIGKSCNVLSSLFNAFDKLISIEKDNFNGNFERMLKCFINGLLFRATYFYSLTSIFGQLSDKNLLQFNKLRCFSTNLIKKSIHEAVESFYDSDGFIYEKKLNSIVRNYKVCNNNKTVNEFSRLRKDIFMGKEVFDALKIFFEEKFRIEENYLEKRNNLYFKTLNVEKEEKLISNVKLSIEISRKLQQAFKVMYVSFISLMVEEHCNKILKGEPINFDLSRWNKCFFGASLSYYSFFLNIRVLKNYDSNCYIPFFGKDFKILDVSYIYTDIAKFKGKIDKEDHFYDQNDINLMQLFKEISSNTDEIKFWEDFNKDLENRFNKDQKGGEEQVEKEE